MFCDVEQPTASRIKSNISRKIVGDSRWQGFRMANAGWTIYSCQTSSSDDTRCGESWTVAPNNILDFCHENSKDLRKGLHEELELINELVEGPPVRIETRRKHNILEDLKN